MAEPETSDDIVIQPQQLRNETNQTIEEKTEIQKELLEKIQILKSQNESTQTHLEDIKKFQEEIARLKSENERMIKMQYKIYTFGSVVMVMPYIIMMVINWNKSNI